MTRDKHTVQHTMCVPQWRVFPNSPSVLRCLHELESAWAREGHVKFSGHWMSLSNSFPSPNFLTPINNSHIRILGTFTYRQMYYLVFYYECKKFTKHIVLLKGLKDPFCGSRESTLPNNPKVFGLMKALTCNQGVISVYVCLRSKCCMCLFEWDFDF